MMGLSPPPLAQRKSRRVVQRAVTADSNAGNIAAGCEEGRRVRQTAMIFAGVVSSPGSFVA
jgi:hypothetical protein